MEITLLDGSIGQELVKRSGDRATPLWSTSVMIEKPELVNETHAAYFKVGASVATTNTYAVLYDRLKTKDLKDQRFKLWETAIRAATTAREAHGSGRIAGSIGPLIASYRPDICPSPDQAEELYSEIIQAIGPHVDVLLIETMCSIDQADGAMRAAKKSGRSIWLAFSVDDFDGTKLRSGEKLRDVKPIVERHQPDAILINCSRPEAVSTGVKIIADFGFKFGAYANGFTKISDGFLQVSPTVDALEQRQDMSPYQYAEFAMDWVALGATIVGGCCEVGPDHIKELAQRLTTAGHTIL
jgi:S-methylmethionine-dependent homocysteine/selenocysteine methylase